MEDKTPPPKNPKTKDLPFVGQDVSETQKEENRGKDQNNTVAKPFVYCTKEGFRRRKTNTRLIHPQYLHQMPTFQNANHEGGKIASAKRFLDSFHRPEGRILACRHLPKDTSIPRFPLQKSKLAIQGHAFRTKHSTPHFHKSDCTRCEGHGRGRNMVLAISRRSPHNCSYKGRVSPKGKAGNRNPRISRLATQHQEISARTCSSISVVRSSFRPYIPHSNGSSREDEFLTTKAEKYYYFTGLHKTRNHATAGNHQLGRYTRPSGPTHDIKDKVHDQILQEYAPGCSHSSQQGYETQSLQMGFSPIHPTKPGDTNPKHHDPDRRFTARLGISGERDTLSGCIRPFNELLHKHFGNVNHLVRSPHDSQEAGSDSSFVRQHHCSSSGQKRNFLNSPSIYSSRVDMEEGGSVSVDTVNCSHSREFQRNSRSTVQEHSTINGMVSSTKYVPDYIEVESQPTGGPLCHQSEQQTGDVYFSLPGHESDSLRCTHDPLEPVGSPISVPSHQHDFEGFSEADNLLLHECSVDHTRDSYQTLVYGSQTTQGPLSPSGSTASTDSGGQTGCDAPNFETSRLEVIKEAYQRRFPDCEEAINLMAAPIRNSSARDYQHKWQMFINFLIDRNISPEEVSISSVFKFLTFLFYEKNLKPGTVAHYRSALTIPLLLSFNIDLKIPGVSDLLRGMRLQRPASPVSQPAWDLKKVLTFIENIPEPISDLMLLRKAAFLLQFSTGYRISELHACVRNEVYCQFHFTPSYKLRLRPHPLFLAKNECPTKRWTHKEVRSLRLPNGNFSKLCPVTTLREYLDRTSRVSTGQLFRSHKKGLKELSIHELKTHIINIVLLGDPQTRVKVHDVRKYATSCALAETMLVGELVRTVGWSSAGTFFRYYLTQTEPLPMPVSLPVPTPRDLHYT